MLKKVREFYNGQSYIYRKKYRSIEEDKRHHRDMISRKAYYKKNFTKDELQMERLYIKHKLSSYTQPIGTLYWYIFSIFFSATLTFSYHVPQKIEDKMLHQVVDYIIQKEGEKIANDIMYNEGIGIQSFIDSLEKENIHMLDMLYEGSVYKLYYLGIDIILIIFFVIITSLVGYGFLNKRKAASLKFNLLIVEEILQEYKENTANKE